MNIFGKRSLENLRGIHPNLVALIVYANRKSDIDFGVDAGLRTVERQKELYSWGRTIVNPNTGPIKDNKFGMIVTNKNGITNKSDHQAQASGFGEAVDIYPYYNGSLQTKDTKTLLKIIDKIRGYAKELGIDVILGADWKNPNDPPHIQLK
jgi:peptidoglycan L-alanyl-D-glutamate endopeptidase CwlK